MDGERPLAHCQQPNFSEQSFTHSHHVTPDCVAVLVFNYALEQESMLREQESRKKLVLKVRIHRHTDVVVILPSRDAPLVSVWLTLYATS